MSPLFPKNSHRSVPGRTRHGHESYAQKQKEQLSWQQQQMSGMGPREGNIQPTPSRYPSPPPFMTPEQVKTHQLQQRMMTRSNPMSCVPPPNVDISHFGMDQQHSNSFSTPMSYNPYCNHRSMQQNQHHNQQGYPSPLQHPMQSHTMRPQQPMQYCPVGNHQHHMQASQAAAQSNLSSELLAAMTQPPNAVEGRQCEFMRFYQQQQQQQQQVCTREPLLYRSTIYSDI